MTGMLQSHRPQTTVGNELYSCLYGWLHTAHKEAKKLITSTHTYLVATTQYMQRDVASMATMAGDICTRYIHHIYINKLTMLIMMKQDVLKKIVDEAKLFPEKSAKSFTQSKSITISQDRKQNILLCSITTLFASLGISQMRSMDETGILNQYRHNKPNDVLVRDACDVLRIHKDKQTY